MDTHLRGLVIGAVTVLAANVISFASGSTTQTLTTFATSVALGAATGYGLSYATQNAWLIGAGSATIPGTLVFAGVDILGIKGIPSGTSLTNIVEVEALALGVAGIEGAIVGGIAGMFIK